MSKEMGRDDFVISARSVFLNKGNRQKFSLLTLIIISIVILSLEYFKSGPVSQIRMITKDIIIKSLDSSTLEDNEKEDIKNITLKLNNWLENKILLNPDQWIWTHNKWKL